MEPSEEILERTGLHWMVYRWPAILLIYGSCLAVLFLTSFINMAMLALPFSLVFIGIVGFVLIAFRRMATEYVVTNKGLILIEGFIGSVDQVIRFDQVRKVELKQDSMARYFDFGRLDIVLDNGSRKVIRPIAGAGKVRRWIDQLANDAFLAKLAGGERAEAFWNKQFQAQTEEPAPLENNAHG
jgi:membrane protein YdbS with pleckstrin-like domain